MNKSGFTLIELLTVIAIIGVLAAVIATSLGSSRDSASESQRLQSVRQVALAMETTRDVTSDDYNGYSSAVAAAIGLNSLGALASIVPGVVFANNVGVEDSFCVYTQQDDGQYFAVSPDGVSVRATVPVVGDCG